MNYKKIIIILIISMSVFSLYFIAIKNTAVYYYTPKEVIEDNMYLSDKNIRIGGFVQQIKEENNQKLIINFIITDLKGYDIKVKYEGIVPDLFKENQGVVAEGVFKKNKLFQASRLMVKHSEEYTKPDSKSINHDLLKNSLFKR